MILPSIELPARPKGLRFEIAAVSAARFDVNPDAGLIEIFDSIGGPGVTLGRVTGALRSIGQKPVTVQLNSYGGDAFEGVAIYNAMRAHGYPITTQILGVAASAASIIAMAGDRVEIAKNGQGMVHRASAFVVGTSETLRTVIELLDRIDAGAADVYRARTGLQADQIAAMMQAETWMSSEEMLGFGFADALLDRDADPAPKTLASNAPNSLRDFEAGLRTLGLSKSRAAAAAAAAWPALSRDDQGAENLDELGARILATTTALKSLRH